MALDRFGAEIFILLKRQKVPLRRLLTLGRQHFAIHPCEFGEVSGLASIVGDNQDLAGTGERFAEPFFHLLGAETVESLDASDYESCSRIHDLNEPIPESWHASYDVVFDGGTLEHVFHFPNAIANAMNLVREGGCFVNCTPCNNYSGHGFYQFSPEVFYRLFDRNRGYRVILMALVEMRSGGRIFSVPDPAELGHRINFQGKDMLQLIMVAKRESVKALTFAPPPCQSDYSASWMNREETGGKIPPRPESNSLKILKQRLRQVLPAGWLQRYDKFRQTTHHMKSREAGLAKVDSLERCFRKDGTITKTEAPSN